MQTATTFTPLSGGPTEVHIPKASGFWDRVKTKLSAKFEAKRRPAGDSLRGEDGFIWKIGPANEYIRELEAEVERLSKGTGAANLSTPDDSKSDADFKTAAALAKLGKENETLKAELAKAKAQNAPTGNTPPATGWQPRNPSPDSPCDPKLLGLCEAVFGKDGLAQAQRLANENKTAVETQIKRWLHFEQIKIPGLDLSDVAAQFGPVKEAAGLLKVHRINLQKKADAYVAQLNAPKPAVELQAKTPKRAPDLIGLSCAVFGEHQVESFKLNARSAGKSHEDYLKLQLAAKAIKVHGVDLSAAEARLGADWLKKVQRWDREAAQKAADKFVAETCF
jgi:hypothetical protein